MSSNELEFPRGNEELAEQIFERMQPELAALTTEKLLNLRVNVVTVVSTVLGCLPRIVEFRARLVKALPEFDVRNLDILEDCAWVLRHAHTLYLACSRPPSCAPEEVQEAATLREQLLNDAHSMTERRIIDPTRLRNVSCLNGYRNLAMDLAILASVLKDSWQQIVGKCPVTLDDLARAGRLSEQFTRVAGRRDKKVASVAKATLDRRRAFTLLSMAYNETRRSVVYLRWHERDSDQIAPSLFAGRRKGERGKKARKVTPQDETAALVAQATPPDSSAIDTRHPANDAQPSPASQA